MSDQEQQSDDESGNAKPKGQTRGSIQIDFYGLKTTVQPADSGDPDPRNWAEVCFQIGQKLRTVARDIFGLVEDTFKSARGLIRGVGQIGRLPNAITERVTRAHLKSDAKEEQKQQAKKNSEASPVSEDHLEQTMHKIADTLSKKGIRLRVERSQGGHDLIFLVGEDQLECARSLARKEVQAALSPFSNENQSDGDRLWSSPFNPLYTFDNFVVGPSTRAAHAAAMTVSKTPGQNCNPLFIHADCGLGKTHLLQAICHCIMDRTPAKRIVYLTCETFVNQFIEAVERGELNSFRYSHRTTDVLVIDDIQFLAGKERTTEEFYHTFNALYQGNKQIILSATCSPKEISGLAEALVSRFSSGLVVQIGAPCYETKRSILEKEADLRDLSITDDAIDYLSKQHEGDIRELQGFLMLLASHASHSRTPVTLELVHQLLDGHFRKSRKLLE